VAGVNVGTAYLEVIPSAKGFSGKLQSQLGDDMAKTGKVAGDKAGKSFGGAFSSHLKSVVGIGAGLALGGGALDFLKDSMSEARDAQKVSAQTAQVIKSTGGAAGASAKQIGDLATAISNKTGVDDEAIQSNENMLLTFTNVKNAVGKGNDIFNQATQTISDMSAALGQDGKSSAIQLGKALNDPVKGITALSRVGVSFTDQQKKQIKGLVAHGDALGAQKVILKELSKEFGGSAAATATAGDKMKVAFGNLKEQVGTALMPVIDKFASFVSGKVVPAISGFITGIQNGTGPGGKLATVVGKIRDAFKTAMPKVKAVIGFLVDNKEAVATFAGIILTVVGAIKVWTAVQAVLDAVLTANPIGLVVVAIAALAAGLVYAYKHSETFRAVVTGAMHAIAEAGKWMWNNVLQPVFSFLVKGIAWIMDKFGDMLETMSHVPGFGWAKGAADAMHGAADSARGLADNIKKIPNHKKVSISVETMWGGPVGQSALANIQKHQAGNRMLGHNANGTDNWRGGPSWVGERGPEIVDIPRGARVIANHKLAAAGVGGHGGAQEMRGVLTIDRDGMAYIRGVVREEMRGQSRAHAQTAGGGGVRF